MLTEQERYFTTASMCEVAAELFWREIKAESDYEWGHITRAEYIKIRRLHAKAERELNRRHSLPYVHKYHKGEYVIGGAEWELNMNDFNVRSIWSLYSKLGEQCYNAIVNHAPQEEISRLLRLWAKAKKLHSIRVNKALAKPVKCDTTVNMRATA